MSPETKFAYLMLLLASLYPVSVFATYALYQFLCGNSFSPRVTYNNPWEFSNLRKPLLGEQQK